MVCERCRGPRLKVGSEIIRNQATGQVLHVEYWKCKKCQHVLGVKK